MASDIGSHRWLTSAGPQSLDVGCDVTGLEHGLNDSALPEPVVHRLRWRVRLAAG